MVVSNISGVRLKAVVAFDCTNGARLIDSTPPANTNCTSPDLIARAASPTASKPEAHKRFTVMAGTESGKPANKDAIRATLRLSSPAWLAQPKITSSSSFQGKCGC